MKIKLMDLMVLSFSLMFVLFFILIFSTEFKLNEQIAENEIQYNYMYFNSERSFILRSLQDYSNWDELRELVIQDFGVSSLIGDNAIADLDIKEMHISNKNESEVNIGDGFYWITESLKVCDTNGKQCLDKYLTISSNDIYLGSGVLAYKEDGSIKFHYKISESYKNTKLFTILFFVFSILLFGFWKLVVIDKWEAIICKLNEGKGDVLVNSFVYEICKISSEITTAFKEKKDALEILEKASITDSLTGLFNRHYLNQVLENDKIKSLIIIDIDNFKDINDKEGHDFGDDVLISVAHTINSNTRDSIDYCFRWGGEEFLILTLVDGEDLISFSDRLRELVKEESGVTVSIGACSSDSMNCLNFKSHYNKADLNLYSAKRTGKNRVVYN